MNIAERGAPMITWIWGRLRWGLALIIALVAFVAFATACGGAPFEFSQQAMPSDDAGISQQEVSQDSDAKEASSSSSSLPPPSDAGNTSDGDPASLGNDMMTTPAADANEASASDSPMQEKENVTCVTPLGSFGCDGSAVAAGYAIDYAVPDGFTSCGLPSSPGGTPVPCVTGAWCEIETIDGATVAARGSCK
jgi:hypothetical protein